MTDADTLRAQLQEWHVLGRLDADTEEEFLARIAELEETQGD